jgi:hypothetical protein
MRAKLPPVLATVFFMIQLEPHPLAALFPPIPEEELAELGRDIALHGQLEPIVLYQGKILDGVNRYRACRRMDREPWTTEFNQEHVKRTPEQYVIAANVRRRHLTPGQLATIALAWAEQLESIRPDALFPKSERIMAGRPRERAIPHAAQSLGVRRQAVYEVAEIRAADPALFEEVRAGRESLGGAMKKIRPPAEKEDELPSEAADQAALDAEAGVPIFAPSPMAAPPPPFASKPAAPRLSRKERIAGAWLEAERVFGEKHAKWLRAGRMSDDEALEFQKLPTESDKKQVRAAMLQGRSFSEAAATLTGLSPAHSIEDLHKRALKEGGRLEGQIGSFFHTVEYRATA